jgi:uncharacterized protein YwgA
MEILDLIIAILNAEPDGIEGRTVIQKLGYFASVKIRMDAGYGADFYGPFSPLVAADLESLVGLDFVVEKGRRTTRDRIMYSYYLTDDGQQLAKKIKQEYPTEYSIIMNVVQKCGKIVHYNFNVLSWAAKVHFVLSQAKKAMTYEEAIGVCRLFGWKLDEREVESAVKLLLALGLIERKA